MKTNVRHDYERKIKDARCDAHEIVIIGLSSCHAPDKTCLCREDTRGIVQATLRAFTPE